MGERTERLLRRRLSWTLRHEKWWERRVWLSPALIITLALFLGLRGPRLGSAFTAGLIATMSSASAVAALSATATGMLALTAIVFSLVFVALQFGSTSYSPRLLQFLSSRYLLASALGVFSGTFLYALLALGAVDVGGTSGVNAVAVWVGVLWLLASVSMLVALLPRVHGLSLAEVLRLVSSASEEAIAQSYPDRFEPRAASRLPPASGTRQLIRHQGAPGYLAAVDEQALFEEARAAGAWVLLLHAVGDFVPRGEPIALVLDAAAGLRESAVRKNLVVAPFRFLRVDPAYGLRLLVDIAIRALSPAINDPSTAVMVLDQLESLLEQLAARDLDVGQVRDGDGALRLVAPTPGWEDLLLLALSEIQLYGSSSLSVERRLGALLQHLEESVPEPRRAAVRRLIARRERLVRQTFPDLDTLVEAGASDPQGLGGCHPLGPIEAGPGGNAAR